MKVSIYDDENVMRDIEIQQKLKNIQGDQCPFILKYFDSKPILQGMVSFYEPCNFVLKFHINDNLFTGFN